MIERSYEKFFRQNRLPHLWCPGCGNGIVMKAIVQAIEKNPAFTQDNTVIVSGIGCSSRASGYMDFDTLHTAHGRAIPFATGVKLARPELNVIVITGDGDCTAIGGNHFIHGCRFNGYSFQQQYLRHDGRSSLADDAARQKGNDCALW